MIIINNREQDIIKIISNLDIPPTLYKNAVEKYKNIATYIKNKGLDVDIYPQGSFALGTVVRPYSLDDSAAYDLDFICQVSNTTRDDMSAKELRELIKNTLNESELYGGKLEVCGECFTIKYANINGFSFSIDIVPAIDESDYNKLMLKQKAINPLLLDTAIAIPRAISQEKYDWLTNNPKGYKEWFTDINDRYLKLSRDYYRQQYYEAHKSVFASIEDIPLELERSALQRVIQILKYHRNVFYSRYYEGEKYKPISAIINTIVTEIAKYANPTMTVYELLRYVINEFYTYSLQLTMTESHFAEKFINKAVIAKKEERWIIRNPANPDDNLADSWSNKTAEVFFEWTKNLKSDLIDSLSLGDVDFRVCVENALGESVVKKSWGEKYKDSTTPTILSSNNYAKPWRMR